MSGLQIGVLLCGSLSILLSGCGVTRLEDVPSAQVLDLQSGVKSQQALLLPPDMEPATVSALAKPHDLVSKLPQSGAQQVSAIAEAGVQPSPQDLSSQGAPAKARWTARFEDGGIDAESYDGEYCSGRQEGAGSDIRQKHAIRIACSDGRTGTFLVENIGIKTSSGTLVFGKDREAAILTSR